ncbi:hypothetical protein J4714_14415 [Staphylococcus epidermidis]|nr:hypothetical protein [Staphylococcus epidermidis]
MHLRGHFCMAKVFGGYWRSEEGGQGCGCSHHQHQLRRGPARLHRTKQLHAAAKAGIAGLTLVQAAELSRYGITVNCLAPAARTSMTEGAMPDMVKKPESGFDVWDPMNVASIACGWLGSQSRHVTGRCFGRAASCPWPTAGSPARSRTKKAAGSLPEAAAVVDQLIAESKTPQRKSTAPDAWSRVTVPGFFLMKNSGREPSWI